MYPHEQKIPNIFGGDNTISKRISKILRSEDPRDQAYNGEPNFPKMREINGKYTENLGIVTFRTPYGQIGLDRSLVKKLTVKQIKEIQNLDGLLHPQTESVDTRGNDKEDKVVFLAHSTLSDIVGKDVVVKKSDKATDKMTAKEQFVASKILKRVVAEAQLDDLVEVNEAFGYIMDGNEKNYLFLERVMGSSLQEMQNNKVEEIPDPKLHEIYRSLTGKLENIIDNIENDPLYITAKDLKNSNWLQMKLKKLKYLNNKTDFNKQKRKHNQNTFPLGFDKTARNYRHFYNQKTEIFNSIKNIIYHLEDQMKDPDPNMKYYIISEAIQVIILNKTNLNSSWASEIKKDIKYGQDNLMYDRIKEKIIIIDSGPRKE